jgi:hypothetical protein
VGFEFLIEGQGRQFNLDVAHVANRLHEQRGDLEPRLVKQIDRSIFFGCHLCHLSSCVHPAMRTHARETPGKTRRIEGSIDIERYLRQRTSSQSHRCLSCRVAGGKPAGYIDCGGACCKKSWRCWKRSISPGIMGFLARKLFQLTQPNGGEGSNADRSNGRLLLLDASARPHLATGELKSRIQSVGSTLRGTCVPW